MYDLQPIHWNNLQIGRVLGKGSFATVYLGRWQGTDVAVKHLAVSQLPADLCEEFQREARIHAQCSASPRIARLFGITQEPGHFALVMEYLPKGALYEVLHDKKIDLPWPTRWEIAIDVGTGLAYLHGAKVLHQDLKSLNVLLDSELRAKISDFGQSKVKTHTATTTTQASGKTTGTVRWRAPESFKRGFKFNEAADVYSYGMILWELATRALPFADEASDMIVMGWIKDDEKETIPADCPSAYARAIQAAWQPAAHRSSANDIVRGLEASQPAPLPAAAAAAVVKQPWHFDPTQRSAGITAHGYELFPAGQEDIDKVMQSYFQHPVPGHDVAKIDVIHNPNLNLAFATRLKLLQARHGNPAFAPRWQSEGTPEQRDQRQHTDRLHQTLTAAYPDTSAPQVRLAPFWHGTEPSILESVFKTGFANLATTDAGFFGKGIYTTDAAAYAHRVYATQNDARLGALLMTWVSSYSAFPVVEGDAATIATKGNYSNYDAHFVPVRPRNPHNPREINYDACAPRQAHQYAEMVVFDAAQCLPRYIVHLAPSGPMPALAAAAVHFPVPLPAAVVASPAPMAQPAPVAAAMTLMPAPAQPALAAAVMTLTPAPTRALQAKVNQLTLHVARGEQNEAEALCRTNPNLLLHKGKVTDYSNRTFQNITAFQYALWAYDWHMWEMLLRYLPPPAAKQQLHDLERNGTKHRKHYDANDILRALKTYVDTYNAQAAAGSYNWNQLESLWSKGVGGAQLRVPTHVANEYCRRDRPFVPTPTFTEPTLPRGLSFYDLNTGLPTGWFTRRGLGWFTGATRVALGDLGRVLAGHRGGARGGPPAGSEAARWGADDLSALSALFKTRTTQYATLQQRLG